ncbi:MAG: RNA polymerase sigma factor [Aridibacter famidurans]|nr:RNA polymerase sigma factor [Aridibacter famidurans]
MNLTSAAINPTIADKREEDRGVSAPQASDQVIQQVITRDTPDYELTQMSAEGDLEAFEMLYQKYHRRAYSLCLRMTNNVTEAEDLTQEAFIQLFRKAGSFRGDSAFTTWFHRLVVNQVLMYFRKRSVKNEKTTEDGEMPEHLVPQTKTKANLPILNRIDINKAIAALPPGYKSVFILHDVEGFEHSEVARILGISVGTSKSQLHKARLKLRGMLVR